MNVPHCNQPFLSRVHAADAGRENLSPREMYLLICPQRARGLLGQQAARHFLLFAAAALTKGASESFHGFFGTSLEHFSSYINYGFIFKKNLPAIQAHAVESFYNQWHLEWSKLIILLKMKTYKKYKVIE